MHQQVHHVSRGLSATPETPGIDKKDVQALKMLQSVTRFGLGSFLFYFFFLCYSKMHAICSIDPI